jgi:hypothetical protein
VQFNLTLTVEQYHLLNESLVAGIAQKSEERKNIINNANNDGLYPELNDNEQYHYDQLGKQEWSIRAIQSELEKQWNEQQY